MQYDFKNVRPVPSVQSLVGLILSKTQRKTPKIVHSQYNISRLRVFYIEKVTIAAKDLWMKLNNISTDFAKLDDLHPFYADFIHNLYDGDRYKLATSRIRSATNNVTTIAKDHVRDLRFRDPPFSCKILKRAALERTLNAAFRRMISLVKRLEPRLSYLKEVQSHMQRIPSINPLAKTLLICGIPNTGKTSFFNAITQEKADVAPYPFSTHSFNVGYTDYKDSRFQVIDTPPLLDCPASEMNALETQTIIALAHLKASILYFFDLSEMCGYTIEQQISLVENICPLIQSKPVLMVFNKIDQAGPNDIEPRLLGKIEMLAKQHQSQILSLCVTSGEGVEKVKETVCELTQQNSASNANGNKEEAKHEDVKCNFIHIVKPKVHLGDDDQKSEEPKKTEEVKNDEEGSDGDYEEETTEVFKENRSTTAARFKIAHKWRQLKRALRKNVSIEKLGQKDPINKE